MNPPRDPSSVARHRIQIEGGSTFEVAASEDVLLRGALRAGIGWPYECSAGGCGACRFDLLSGTMEALWPEAPGLSERDRKRGKRLACQSRPLEDCVIRVRCDDAYRPVVMARKASARLLARRALTAELSEFTFEIPGPAEFRAGQYALLYPPGIQGARAYSMSNLPNGEGRWQFVIRHVPGGLGSTALFERVAVGDEVPFDGPYGHAYLRPGEREVVCIAGGSGLGPMLSVARGVLADGGTRRVRFFLGVRSQADLGAAGPLDALAHERLATTVVLSAPAAAPAWAGATGFVHEEVERALGAPLDRFDFYFAGPPPMVGALQELLMLEHRVPFDQIHFDRFF